MSKVRVHRTELADENAVSAVFGEAGDALDAIRRRAFELFKMRGGAAGCELDDWLQAERELLFVPPADILERETGFRLTMCAPGFDEDGIHVIVSPREVLVEAKTERLSESRPAGARFLYRHFDLPSPILTDEVTARVDEGNLTIEAPKKPVQRRSVRAAAA